VADFTHRADPPRNQRAVGCRICRVLVGAGQAHGFDEYMRDGYRFARRYICGACMRQLGEE
jgi:hypothetical protein